MNMRNVCVLAWAASALLGAPHLAIEIARQAGRPIVLGGMPLDDSERAYFAENVAPHRRAESHSPGPVDHRQKGDLVKDTAALLFPIQWEEPFGLVMIE